MQIISSIELEIYVTEEGKKPFVIWLESMKDKKVRYRIKERLDRVSFGNKGDSKSIKRGVSELRLAFGPGYRIYYGEEKHKIILLLGGTKSTQKADIKKALVYWEDYLAR